MIELELWEEDGISISYDSSLSSRLPPRWSLLPKTNNVNLGLMFPQLEKLCMQLQDHSTPVERTRTKRDASDRFVYTTPPLSGSVQAQQVQIEVWMPRYS